MEQLIQQIAETVTDFFAVQTEASGRHVHLSRKDADFLFGKDYPFQILKELSQPGQFAYKERVDLITAKGEIKNVAILGPCRNQTQAEISMTDAKSLGLNAPVRVSGDIKNSPGITLRANGKCLEIPEGVIVAKRHIHLTPPTAERFDVSDKETVRLKVFGRRPLIFDDVTVRISDQYADRVHLDYDEANACGLLPDSLAFILKKS